jgi:hypothetical protein
MGPMVSLRACGARPSGGMRTRRRGPYGVHPEVPEGRAFRRDALRASAWYGRTNAVALHFEYMR